MDPISGYASALQVSQLANSRLLEAAKALVSDQPDQWIDGIMGLSQAKLQMKTAAMLARTQSEMDDAVLDILA